MQLVFTRLLAGVAASVALIAAGVGAQETANPKLTPRLPSISGTALAVPLAGLPPEVRATHDLIVRGGPFPHVRDAAVFGNREHLLPWRNRGYYLEYTVATPGVHDRGARRLVCGGKSPTRPDTCFYTDDHYASFRQILR